MRKFTSLIAFIVIASFAMAQVHMNHGITKTQAEKWKKEVQAHQAKDGDDVIWSVNFEEEDPVWTFGHDQGDKEWHVTDQDGAPESWKTPQGYYFFYLGYYSETGSIEVEEGVYEADGHWAWVDGMTDLLNGTEQICNTWIQFDGIDLSEVDNPKISFYQLYRPINQAFSFIDFSIDGGETWTEVEVNEDVDGNDYGPIVFDRFIGNYVANESDVSIRFRWQTTAEDIGGYGYGWQIDDIKIIDNPEYDLRVVDTRMNFFDYIDHTVEGQEDWYHISSHYGQIPADQYQSPMALCWFNVEVENMGVETVTPSLNIKVHDPDMDVIFDETIVGVEMAITDRQIMDMIEVDFSLDADPKIGEYIIAYEVFIDGIEDENPDDNVDTANFFVTECTMSRDAKSVTGRTGPGVWLSGGNDGDMVGTDYLYLYEDEIHSLDVFIDENSDVGTAFIARIMEYDAGSESHVDITTSALTMIEEEHLGEWVNVDFIDPAIVSFSGDDDFKNIRAAIEFYYNDEENDLFIGIDRSNQNSIWGTVWYFTDGANANQWISLGGSEQGLAIRLNTTCPEDPDNFVEGIEDHNINIYPNPTAGTINIENVKGANIEIMNLMGQTIESVYNANEFNTVDMSQYANGTYIVRIVKDGSVITSKINVID